MPRCASAPRRARRVRRAVHGRTQGGQRDPGRLPGVQWKVADMATQLEGAPAAATRCTWPARTVRRRRWRRRWRRRPRTSRRSSCATRRSSCSAATGSAGSTRSRRCTATSAALHRRRHGGDPAQLHRQQRAARPPRQRRLEATPRLSRARGDVPTRPRTSTHGGRRMGPPDARRVAHRGGAACPCGRSCARRGRLAPACGREMPSPGNRSIVTRWRSCTALLASRGGRRAGSSPGRSSRGRAALERAAPRLVVDLDALPVGTPVLEPWTEREQLACVIWTSGSSGAPKGVLHTQATLKYKAASWPAHGLGPLDCVLTAPCAHQRALERHHAARRGAVPQRAHGAGILTVRSTSSRPNGSRSWSATDVLPRPHGRAELRPGSPRHCAWSRAAARA